MKRLYAKTRYILLLCSKSKSRSRELRRPPTMDRRDIGHWRDALQCINRCLYHTKSVCFIRVRADHTFNSFGRVGFKYISVGGKEKTKQKESTHLIVCGVMTRCVIMRWLNVIETSAKKKKIVFYLKVFWRFIRRGCHIWFFPKKKKNYIVLGYALELPVSRVRNFTCSRTLVFFYIYFKFIMLL